MTVEAWARTFNELIGTIEALVRPDPWETSGEGLDDACHFCGSGDRTWAPGPDDPHWRRRYWHVHDDTCPWVHALELLDHPLPDGHAVRSDRPDWWPR